MEQQTVRVDVPGKGIVEFPAGTTPEQIESALAQFRVRSTGSDVAIGATKGVARTLLDLGQLAARSNPLIALANLAVPGPARDFIPGNIPAHVRKQLDARLATENTNQAIGSGAVDFLSAAVPAGMAARGSNLARRGAVALERHAVPAMSKRMAEQALSRGAGRVSEASAKALQAEAKRTPSISATVVQRAGQWVPKSKGPSRLQATADAMSEAAAAKTAPVSPGELAWTLGGGGIFGVPGVLAGVAKMASRPLPSSIAAQTLYSGAPALQAIGGGAAGGLGNVLLSLLRGER